MPADIFIEIEQTAARYADKIALEMFDEEKGDQTYTYCQMMERADAVSRSLHAHGLGKGDRVVLWARLAPNWVVAYLGTLRQGMVAVPIDFEYDAKTLATILRETGCRVLFSVKEKLPAIEEARKNLERPPLTVLLDAGEDSASALGLQTLLRQGEDAANDPGRPERLPDDVATIFFTSGTTGRPKGVVIEHRSMANTLNGLMQYLRVTSQDKVLAVIPAHHIFASLANLLMPLLKGGTTTFLCALNSTELLRTMQKGHSTIFPAVPLIFYLLHKKIFEEVERKPLPVRLVFKLLLAGSRGIRNATGMNPGPTLFAKVHAVFGGKLRLLVSAASYFDPKVIRDFYSLGFTVQQGYALTETFGGGTFTPYFDNVIGSAGKPLPGVDLRIVNRDESGVGEIAIAGPSVMREYLNDPAATTEVLRDGWFYTGDLASQDDAGNVFIRGRRKELIVLTSGKKVYPEEVELHYQQYPYIKEMCVMGVPGAGEFAAAERLHAVIVPDFEYMKQQRVVNAKEIIREGVAQYSASLPQYKRLLSYEIQTDPLPRTASRKLIRSRVKAGAQSEAEDQGGAQSGGYHTREGDDLLLATETSRQALAIIRREAKVDRQIHPDMNLELDLGFDSLQRIELLTQIEQALGVRLGDEVANQTFSVRDLLRTIAQKKESGEVIDGKSPAAARVTWKEIIASARTDDMAERYILEPRTHSHVIHFLALCLIYAIARVFFRLNVHGVENLPHERPYLICPNHEGYMDGPLVSAALPYRVIRHLFTLGFTPFFSGGFKDWIARTGRIVPVDADTNLGRAMRIAAIGLKARQNLLIFPEGGLTCDGELQTFKKGVGILVRELQIPVVPVAIEGSFEAWSKVGDGVKLFSPISITFGPPIHFEFDPADDQNPDREYARIAAQIRDTVGRMLQN
jgi:long-chain acyl-CoA synthetase